MENQILYDSVRAELGKITNLIDIGDADILRESGYILQRIAQKITKKVFRYITSKVDTREYDVATTTLRVQEVFPGGITDIEQSDLLTLSDPVGSLIVGSELANENYNFPSLWMIRRMKQLRSLPRIRWEYNPIERKLKIDPTPTSAGEKIYYISVEKTIWVLKDIPEDFEEIVITGTTWKCAEIVAMRRSTEGGIERSGGRVEYPADSVLRYAKTKQEDFNEELDIKSRLYNL